MQMLASLISKVRLSGCSPVLNRTFLKVSDAPVLYCQPYALSCCFSKQQTYRQHDKKCFVKLFPIQVQRHYRSTIRHTKNGSQKQTESEKSENIDDLKSLLQNKSMSFTAKFKLLFQQYGVVLVVVHCITAVFWMSLFYFAVSRGLDIIPFMEKYGVFNFLEKFGISASEKLKNPSASNLLAAYLLYEIAKPVRYPVTIVGTIYAVRLLRRLGRLKQPPKTDATIGQIVHTQGKIVRHHVNNTATKYRDRYSTTSRLRRATNGKKTNAQQFKKNGKKGRS